MWGSIYFIEGSQISDLRFRIARWRGSHVGKDHLHPLGPAGAAPVGVAPVGGGPLGLVLEQDFQRLAELMYAGIGGEKLPSAGSAIDAVEVGSQGQRPPAHLEELLFENGWCIGH